MRRARTIDRASARAIALAVPLTLAAAAPEGPAWGQGTVAPPSVPVSASVTPPTAKLGERVTYRAKIALYGDHVSYEWLPPQSSGDLVWGKVRAQVRAARESKGAAAGRPSSRDPDTLVAEVPLQVFRTGTVTIPGISFRTRDRVAPKTYRVPGVTLNVTSVLPADDATLKPVRGPLGAPWWERVPWTWVVLGTLVLLALVRTVMILRGRRRPVLSKPVIAPPVDPAAAALAELAALRGLNLPGHGRFAEHAFHLSRIARVFLEATTHAPLPGDTTAELLDHLRAAGLEADDVERMRVLLRGWDQVKFARAPSSAEDARRSENSVEMLIRRVSGPSLVQEVA